MEKDETDTFGDLSDESIWRAFRDIAKEIVKSVFFWWAIDMWSLAKGTPPDHISKRRMSACIAGATTCIVGIFVSLEVIFLKGEPFVGLWGVITIGEVVVYIWISMLRLTD